MIFYFVGFLFLFFKYKILHNTEGKEVDLSQKARIGFKIILPILKGSYLLLALKEVQSALKVLITTEKHPSQ